MTDELKPNTTVRVPIRTYATADLDTEARSYTESFAVGRVMIRHGYGYDGHFTRDYAGQYMVEVGHGVNPLRVVAHESEIEVIL